MNLSSLNFSKLAFYSLIVAFSFSSFYLTSCNKSVDKKENAKPKSKYSNIDKMDGADTATIDEFPAHYKIVYINTDTLWEHYEFVKDSKKKLEAMEKQMRGKYNEKYAKMQSDYEYYVKGAQKGILTKDQMIQKETSLKQQQDEVMALDNELSAKLMKNQEELNNRVKDTIQSFLHRFRVEKGYTMIIQYGYLSALLSGDEKLDVTESATKGLNKEYQIFRSQVIK